MCNEMKPWEPYLPEHVCLYYVDYDNDLDDNTKILQKCIENNNLYPISESIDDWWEFPEGHYLDDMQKAMENDDMEWDDDWRDEIIEALREKDESDPVKDLINNTSDLHCYFDLGYDVDEPFGAEEEEQEEEIDGICKVLKIAKDSSMREKIAGIYYNASYGGSLRIYFPAGLMTLLSGNGWDGSKQDFESIKFKGKFRVVIIDTMNGSGDFEDDIELDVEYEFDRSLLGVSEDDHYSFEEIFGDDCGIKHCETPTFEKKAEAETVHVENETLRQEREKQQLYNDNFKAGKCTFGDRDMNRHRDIEYVNAFPCGWHCPHCGMSWTD